MIIIFLWLLDWPIVDQICLNKALHYNLEMKMLYTSTRLLFQSLSLLHGLSYTVLKLCSGQEIFPFLEDFSVGDLLPQSGPLGSSKYFSRYWRYIHKWCFRVKLYFQITILIASFFVCLFSFRTTTFKSCMKILSAKWEILLMCVGLSKTSDWMVIPSTWAKHLMHTCVCPVCQLVTSSKLWQQPRLSHAVRISKDKSLTHCYIKLDEFLQISLVWEIFLLILELVTEILRRSWHAKGQIHYLPNCKLLSNIKKNTSLQKQCKLFHQILVNCSDLMY